VLEQRAGGSNELDVVLQPDSVQLMILLTFWNKEVVL
jgi:hypothetical protein